jgi:hypothetical protein
MKFGGMSRKRTAALAGPKWRFKGSSNLVNIFILKATELPVPAFTTLNLPRRWGFAVQ